jgi:hypothetical protein
LAVYDGTKQVGEIDDRGRGKATAFCVGPRLRIKVGVFENRTAAMRAIIAAARNAGGSD